MRQQNDPIAQAMQILQFITQRRGQQADIAQGQQRLDLAQQGMHLDRRRAAQQNQQFQQGMAWDRERALMQQKQFEEAQNRAMVEAAMRNVADQRKIGADEVYRQQMLDQQRQQTEAQKIQSLREMLPDMQNQALMYADRPDLLSPIQQEIQQIMQRIKAFHGLQPIQPAPVDPVNSKIKF